MAYTQLGATRTAVSGFNGNLVNVNADNNALTFNFLQISTGPKTQGQSNGTIARLTYYPTRLQDFQLQQLTK